MNTNPSLITTIADIVTILTLISVLVAVIQLIKQNKLIKAANHLELRKMFSDGNRFIIYTNLSSKGIWHGSTSINLTAEEQANLYDYIGLFENCEYMLRNKLLDEKLFEISYKYRLTHIAKNVAVMSLIESKIEYWEVFLALLNRYNIK